MSCSRTTGAAGAVRPAIGWFSTPGAIQWENLTAARKQLWKQKNMIEWPIAPDGHCLPRALAVGLWGDGDRMQEIRDACGDFITKHKHQYAAGRDDNEFDVLVQGVRETAYCGQEMIDAFQRLFRCSVCVVQLFTNSEAAAWVATSRLQAESLTNPTQIGKIRATIKLVDEHKQRFMFRNDCTHTSDDAGGFGDNVVVSFNAPDAHVPHYNLVVQDERSMDARNRQRNVHGSMLCTMDGCHSVEKILPTNLTKHIHTHLKLGEMTTPQLQKFLDRFNRRLCAECKKVTMPVRGNKTHCIRCRKSDPEAGNRLPKAKHQHPRQNSKENSEYNERQPVQSFPPTFVTPSTIELPTMAEVAAMNVPTVQNIPARARDEYLRQSARLFRAIADTVEGARHLLPWQHVVLEANLEKEFEEKWRTRLELHKHLCDAVDRYSATGPLPWKAVEAVAWRNTKRKAAWLGQWAAATKERRDDLDFNRGIAVLVEVCEAREEWESSHAPAINRGVVTDDGERASNCSKAWRDYFLFVKCVLRTSKRMRRGRHHHQLDIPIERRMQLWENGSWQPLWASASKVAKDWTNTKTKHNNQDGQRLRLAKKKVRLGDCQGARQILSSKGPATGPDALDKVRSKYPSADDDTQGRVPMPAQSLFLHDDPHVAMAMQKGMESWVLDSDFVGRVEATLQQAAKYKRGKAPGRSGLRYEHLNCVEFSADQDGADEFTSALAGVIRVMLRGQFPDDVRQLLCSGNVLCFKKPAGGIRPIVVTEVLARLSGKVALLTLKNQLPDMVGPTQMGAGKKGGAEAVVHAAQHAFDECSRRNEQANKESDYNPWVVLTTDCKNAFGEINRTIMLRCIREKCPALLPYVQRFYGQKVEVFFEGKVVDVARGILQGDTLAQMLQAIVLRVLFELCEIAKRTQEITYADDSSFIARAKAAVAIYERIQKDGPKHGVIMGAGKLQLTIPNPRKTAQGDISLGRWEVWADSAGATISHNGLTVLGCPVGLPSYGEKFAEILAKKVEEEMRQIMSLGDPLLQLKVMRSAMTSRVNHILRGSLPKLSAPTALMIDSTLAIGIRSVLGLESANFDSWTEALLAAPRLHGGLSLGRATNSILDAYLGSRYLTQPLVQMLVGTSPALPLAAKKYHESGFKSLTGMDLPPWGSKAVRGCM